MKRIPVLYTDEMYVDVDSRSKSPLKPKLFVDVLRTDKRFEIQSFKPYTKNVFKIAHTNEYVNGFFKGEEDYTSSIDIHWSKQYAESVRYTNASLYEAIKASLKSGFSISPTSGFHHATPKYGLDFCAFSGQVIASSKLYDEEGLSGAHIDLDAHYGNSIDDSYKFVKNLFLAIPKGMNINPMGIDDKHYLNNLKHHLDKVNKALNKKQIHYVVLGHGADSIIGDDLDCGVLTPEAWIEAARLVSEATKGYPLVYSLFGGYRKDLNQVVDFHIQAVNQILLTSEVPVGKSFIS